MRALIGATDRRSPSFTVICLITSIFFNRYTIFLFGIYLYATVIALLGGLGGVVALTKTPSLMVVSFRDGTGLKLIPEYWELVLLFYLYCYGNLILRPSKMRPWLAALPIFLVYLIQDIYYLAYSSVFRLSGLAEAPELLKLLPWPYLLVLAGVFTLLLGYYLVSIQYQRYVVLLVGAVPFMLLTGAVYFFPTQYTALYQRVGQTIEFWSDDISAMNNGRLMMLFYREAERRLVVAQTRMFRNREAYEQEAQQLAKWIEAHGNRRDVHLVVMESFFDPTLLKKANLTKNPFHPDFQRLFGNKMGFSLSPVFGGKTAQAEFEALCGVHAFGEMTGVEFNSFTGSPANCLPGVLGQAGYDSIASNAYKPSFFNALKAYKGIGFSEMYFPQEFDGTAKSYLRKGDTSGEMEYMFDGNLFTQNLEFITPLLKAPGHRPLFNYVLTIYGHMPHLINKEKRPLVLKMQSPCKDQFLEWSANQIYYRSQAVADYVNNLMSIDPESLIILVSDHLPPGQYGMASYQKLQYLDGSEKSMHMNRILIVEAGKVKTLATIHHYDIPALIINSITDGAYCRENKCDFTAKGSREDRLGLHDAYMRVMAHASE